MASHIIDNKQSVYLSHKNMHISHHFKRYKQCFTVYNSRAKHGFSYNILP